MEESEPPSFESAVAGSVAGDSTGEIFDFTPIAAYNSGSLVEIFAGDSIYDLSGVRISPFYSSFTTVDSPVAPARAVSFSASSVAIDVRFSGAVPESAAAAYLRSGSFLILTRFERTGSGHIRFIPSTPLAADVNYGLVLSADQEIAFRVGGPTGDFSLRAVSQTPTGIRLKLNAGVNPLTVNRARLIRPDGAAESFHVLTSLDMQEVVLVPAKAGVPFEIVLDGLESRSGHRLSQK